MGDGEAAALTAVSRPAPAGPTLSVQAIPTREHAAHAPPDRAAENERSRWRARFCKYVFWPRLRPLPRTRIAMVPNHITDSGNPYQAMMYSAMPADIYPCWRMDHALRAIRLGHADLLHVHFDECYCAGVPLAEDVAAAERFVAGLEAHRRRGGRLAWTLHNNAPEPYARRPGFPRVRRYMARTADLIQVHTKAAARHLVEDHGTDPARIVEIAHPSFLGWMPAPAEPSPPPLRRRFLQFGEIKPYKGVDLALAAFARIGCPERVAFTIAGRPDPGLEIDTSGFPAGATLRTELRRIPSDAVPGLFAEADFALLPYRIRLTSAVGLLAVSQGVPVIAPDLGELRDSLPAEMAPLLYDPEDPDGLLRALERACRMPAEEHLALRRACLDHAWRLRPEVQSRRLWEAFCRFGLACPNGAAAPDSTAVAQ